MLRARKMSWGASWGAARIPCQATVELGLDGRVTVRCATQDIGTGTYTVFAQVMQEKTGLPYDRIHIILGDSGLPEGPMSGGSMATSAVLPAAAGGADAAIARLLHIATLSPESPFYGKKPEALTLTAGRVHAKDNSSNGVPFEEIIRKAGLGGITATGKTSPSWDDPKAKGYSMHSYGAHFAEVEWEPEIARVRVSRIVSVFDCGRIINRNAAENQILGAAVMGVGMALLEETCYDSRTGQPINGSFADYLVATSADLPHLDVTYLDYPDLIVNEYGARGVGEIGMAGVAPAIAAAVHHATGVRVRDLPIRIEDLLKSTILEA